jgi:hypothetical protein
MDFVHVVFNGGQIIQASLSERQAEQVAIDYLNAVTNIPKVEHGTIFTTVKKRGASVKIQKVKVD